MPSSLRDIPGSAAGSGWGRVRRLWRRRERRSSSRAGSLGFGPVSLHLERDDRAGRKVRFRRLRKIDFGGVLAWGLGVGTVVLVAVLAYRGTRVDVDQAGLDDGAVLNAMEAAALDVRITFASAEDASAAKLYFDGRRVREPDIERATMRWRPPQGLDEGEHRLSLSVPRVLLNEAKLSWDFTMDATPPAIEAPEVAEPVGMGDAAVVAGTVERGAELAVAGRQADVDDGRFSMSFARPPAGPVVLEAVDRAGNTSTASVVVPVSYPGMRGVHISAAAWSDRRLRDGVLQLADEGRIDTIILGLKDESGIVGFDTTVERARQIGAVTAYVNLEQAVATAEEHGARLVGRIAAFRDPRLAQAAWGAGQPNQVIQTPAGTPYDGGEFTNFADPDVRRYNLDIALDAVSRGVTDILWDEVRRPGDDPTNVVVPSLQGSASESLVRFLGNAHTELRRRGVYQGVAVLGISADRGDLVAQDIAQMARHGDYLMPTIHPAYWGSNEFGVADPIRQPGDLVNRVVARFVEVTQTSGTRIMPSLQDFSARGVGYGEGQIRWQIDGARAAGADRFALWDPSATYTGAALDPIPR